jgi:deoxycytidylate deaminase
MKLDLSEALEHANRFAEATGGCPRAAVATYLYDEEGNRIARASNARFDGKCDCNDEADTLTTASSTCCAVHSEVAALLEAARLGQFNRLDTAVVTRPPCCKCLPALLSSPVNTIVTSDEWPDRDGTEAVWRRFGRLWYTLSNKKAP